MAAGWVGRGTFSRKTTMTDGSRDPWAGTTYNGFSGGSAPPAPPSPAPEPRRRHRGWIVGGVAAAALLGLGVGMVTREDMGDEPGLPDPPVDVASSPAVPIEVAAVEPTPASPPAATPLEVLPADMAKAAAAATP